MSGAKKFYDGWKKNQANRHFGILLPMTNRYRKIAVNLGTALANHGANVSVLEIPGLSNELLQKCDPGLLAEFYAREGITDTFSIGASRQDLHVPEGIAHHGLPRASWPESLPPATSYHAFYQDPRAERDYTAEIGMTCDYILPMPDLSEGSVEVLEPFFAAAREQLIKTQDYSHSLACAQSLFQKTEAFVGRALQGPRERIIAFMASDFIPSVMRSERARHLVSLAKKHGWRLKITGRYWDQVPEFKAYCVGFVGQGEPMARFLQHCKAVIHLPGDGNVQWLDILACGGFGIFRDHPGESALSSIKTFFPEELRTGYQTDEDLEKTLVYYLKDHPEQRQDRVRAAGAFINNNFTYDVLAQTLLGIGRRDEAEHAKHHAPSMSLS